jgi:hypothetical protein
VAMVGLNRKFFECMSKYFHFWKAEGKRFYFFWRRNPDREAWFDVFGGE